MAPKIEKIRNIGIMAHIDAGKTTVSERILFYSGRTYKIAEVHDGQATMDFMDQERERGITISSAVNEIQWKGNEIYLIDTPGHVDFTVEVERSLRVLDGVVALYDAVSGVEPQSETVWYQANRHDVVRLAFINKMDRPGADFDRCVTEIQKILGGNPIEVQLPMGSGSDFVGVMDLIRQKAYYFDTESQGAEVTTAPIPAEFEETVALAREQMIEKIADVDDVLGMAWLEGEEMTEAMIVAALRRATISLKAQPVLCGSGLKNKGIQPLMDAIVDYLPAPQDLPPLHAKSPKGEDVLRERSEKSPLSALVFKVQQIEGKKLAFIRVYSGCLKDGDSVYVASSKSAFKVKNIYRVYANRVDRVEQAPAGAIVAIAKVKGLATGVTLCDPAQPILLESIKATAPVISIAIEPESLKDKDRLVEALGIVHEEDPTLVFEEDKDTGELILRGMGELHLEVACERLRREFNVNVRTGHPNVVCMEALMRDASETATFERLVEDDKDLIWGEVSVFVRALPRGTGSRCALALPSTHPYIRQEVLDAVLEAARDASLYGPNGYEMADVSVEITSISLDARGNVHLVGTRIAAGEAVRRAYKKAGTKTLEPLMAVDIVAAEEHIGDLISDLTQRGGMVENLESDMLRSVIHAIVPLKNMFGYTMKLRTLTHGRGSFSMRFLRFDAII